MKEKYQSDKSARILSPSHMEKLGLFGLLEVGLTAMCIENGVGGKRRKDKQEKGNRECDEVHSSSKMEKENEHFQNSEMLSMMEKMENHDVP